MSLLYQNRQRKRPCGLTNNNVLVDVCNISVFVCLWADGGARAMPVFYSFRRTTAVILTFYSKGLVLCYDSWQLDEISPKTSRYSVTLTQEEYVCVAQRYVYTNDLQLCAGASKQENDSQKAQFVSVLCLFIHSCIYLCTITIISVLFRHFVEDLFI